MKQIQLLRLLLRLFCASSHVAAVPYVQKARDQLSPISQLPLGATLKDELKAEYFDQNPSAPNGNGNPPPPSLFSVLPAIETVPLLEYTVFRSGGGNKPFSAQLEIIYDIHDHDHDELKEHLVPTMINGLIRRPDHVIGLHFHFATPNEAGTILIESINMWHGQRTLVNHGRLSVDSSDTKVGGGGAGRYNGSNKRFKLAQARRNAPWDPVANPNPTPAQILDSLGVPRGETVRRSRLIIRLVAYLREQGILQWDDVLGWLYDEGNHRWHTDDAHRVGPAHGPNGGASSLYAFGQD